MLQNPNWQDISTATPLILAQENGFYLLQENGFLIYVDGIVNSWFQVSTNQNPVWQAVATAQNPNWQVVT